MRLILLDLLVGLIAINCLLQKSYRNKSSTMIAITESSSGIMESGKSGSLFAEQVKDYKVNYSDYKKFLYHIG